MLIAGTLSFMLRLLLLLVTVISLSVPTRAADLAVLIPPQPLNLKVKVDCKNNVGVFKIRNEANAWQHRGVVSFVALDGEVLFKRVFRLAHLQSLTYRIKRKQNVSAVRVRVSYPGTTKYERILRNPCG